MTQKTIVITGASSGIGKATALYFHEKGWNVVATMRNPKNEQDLKEDDRMKIVELDVENKESIQQAVQTILSTFDTVDVWLNNG